MKRIITLAALILIAAQASGYYADITIDVDSSGFVRITGSTDHPTLLTDYDSSYTSKSNERWLLNITEQGAFSELIYTVKLPAGSSINYIKAAGTMRIEESGVLLIKGFGENIPLSIIVQYETSKKEESFPIMTVIIITGAILLALAALIIIKRKPGKIKKKVTDTSMLPERQRQIIELLLEKKKPLTQAQIQKTLNLPKASASRNIRALELKGFVEKEDIGITNMIKLAE